MAAVTRPKAPKAPATKASSKAKSSNKAKAPSRPKASQKATDNAILRRLIQKELAKVRVGQPNTHRVRKSRSHRHHRRHHYSSESSTDSEEGDRPRVSFLHHEEGTKLFLDLAARYPTVLIKYFKQIFFKTFAPENLTKLSQGIADRAAIETPQETKKITHMLLCLKIYSQIILHFSAVPLLS